LSDSWGLPRRYFDPKAFYQKCMRQSESMIFFHQGKEEGEDSKRIIRQLGGSILHEAVFDQNPWVKRRFPVVALLWGA